MDFVYFGYDFMLPAVRNLVARGHRLKGVFSFECDNIFNFNQQTQQFAKIHKAPFTLEPPTPEALQPFLAQGVGCFLSAGYRHKIPPIDDSRAYAVNVHPTALPLARGVMPIPRILLQNMQEAAGFTAHKMTQRFDEGDILLQETFALSPRETVETYCAKIAMRAPDMLERLFAGLPALWQNARPQDHARATWLKAPTEDMRFLDPAQTIAEIDRVGRAFGRFGSFIRFNNQVWAVFNYDIWAEAHSYTVGEVVATLSRETTLAVKDGFLTLKEFYPVT